MNEVFERYTTGMQDFDTMVLYYAGHGYTDNLYGRPYRLPVDAGADRHEKLRWLDAGLGGHSLFAFHLLDALEHSGEEWLDAVGLYDRVRRGVRGQAPQYGVLPIAGHQEGGACILRRLPALSPTANTYTEDQYHVCPECGFYNRVEQTFKCLKCGRNHLCRSHYDAKFRMCGRCTEQEEKNKAAKAEDLTTPSRPTVVGSNPSSSKGARLPVECVSWFDAVSFCNALSRRDGLEEVYTIKGETVKYDWGRKGYRLPTETEWEYAARGGSKSKGYTYAGSNTEEDVAWYGGNSNFETHEVGTKRANELGLYDMSGNVWDWCWDWYDSDYYGTSPATNSRGPSSGSYRVLVPAV